MNLPYNKLTIWLKPMPIETYVYACLLEYFGGFFRVLLSHCSLVHQSLMKSSKEETIRIMILSPSLKNNSILFWNPCWQSRNKMIFSNYFMIFLSLLHLWIVSILHLRFHFLLRISAITLHTSTNEILSNRNKMKRIAIEILMLVCEYWNNSSGDFLSSCSPLLSLRAS